MPKHLYIFSGLGADASVFHKLDFANYHPHFIQWVKPQEDEPIEDYSKRLLAQVPAQQPILLGLSFGGIMAIEVAKQIATEKVIVINSVKTHNELPWYYRLSGRLNLHKLMPASFLKEPGKVTNWLFGVRSYQDEQLLNRILEHTDTIFLKWAIDKIVKWRNSTQPENIYHIHGESDRILPVRYTKPDISIPHGGHLMVLDKAEIINVILRRQLNNFQDGYNTTLSL